MLRQVFATTAAVALLAGCNGGDDKPSADNTAQDGSSQSPGTPSVPAPTPYDPPKAFQAVAASALPKENNDSTFDPLVGMVGTTAVANTLSGATGQSVTGTANAWWTPSSETTDDSVRTNDASRPAAVQVDGKPAVAIAYYQRVQGGGTAKPGVRVLFRWLDPVDGKPMSEATVDATALLGDNEVDSSLPGGFTDLAVDPATGRLAVGLAPTSLIGAKSGVITVIADPATGKGVAVPFMKPAGISKGVLVGAQGKSNTQRSVALVDAATGKVTKSGLLPGLEGLNPTGGSGKYVYLYGQKYDKNLGLAGDQVGYLFAVDPATGAVVQTKSAVTKTQYLLRYACRADSQKTVVCAADRAAADEQEIVAFDDTTGQKIWGYTDKSAGRVVPEVTAVWHGMVYGTVEKKPVLLNALTGQDVPVPAPTPSTPPTDPVSPAPTDGSTPTEGGTPTDGSTPTDGVTPSDGVTPTSGPVPAQPDYELLSPESVSEYGGAYLREDDLASDPTAGTLQVLKAVG